MNWIEKAAHKLLTFFTSGKAEQDAIDALNLAAQAKPLVEMFAASGNLPDNVTGILKQYDVYEGLAEKYSKPVIDTLTTSGEPALKVLMNLGVAAIIAKIHNVSGTQGLIAANTAYLEVANAPSPASVLSSASVTKS
jgi:hypothetical protein